MSEQMNLDNLYYPGKVCNGLQSTKNSDNCQQLLSTASFCSVCKKVALATKEEKKTRKQNMVRSKCQNNVWFQF